MKNIQEILDGMRTFLVNTDRHDGDMLDATEVHAALNQFADELEAWWSRSGLLRVPLDVWNDMARKVESADALRGAIDGLPNITETDARSIELIAKYAINHSMYGGGIILSMTGAVREAKRVIAKQRGGAA